MWREISFVLLSDGKKKQSLEALVAIDPWPHIRRKVSPVKNSRNYLTPCPHLLFCSDPWQQMRRNKWGLYHLQENTKQPFLRHKKQNSENYFFEEVFFGLSHKKKGSLHTILPDTWHIEPNCLWHPIIWRDHPFHLNFFFPLFKGRQLKRSPDYSLFVPGLVAGQIIDCSQ